MPDPGPDDATEGDVAPVLATWMPRQRWYATKGSVAPPVRVEVEDHDHAVLAPGR